MTSQRDPLIVQVRNVLDSLSGLPEDEIREAVMEVLRLNAPFHHISALEEIFRESIDLQNGNRKKGRA
jgi:hypothetical protein